MTDILIVDDNAAFRRMLRGILLSRLPALNIREAPEGDSALQAAEKKVPDLIFMDIRLPGENGFELTKRFKTRYPGVPVFIMTSFDSPEYREAAFQSGADNFLSKQVSTPEDIVQRVTTLFPLHPAA